MPTQETPAGHEIPAPKRRDVFRDMRKVVGKQPVPQKDSDAGGSGAEEQGK